VLHRIDENGARFPPQCDDFGVLFVAPSRGDAEVRERLHILRLVHRPAVLTEHRVADDGQQPVADACVTAKRSRTAPRPEKCVLQSVFGSRIVRRDDPSESKHRRRMTHDQLIERGPITCRRPVHQLCVAVVLGFAGHVLIPTIEYRGHVPTTRITRSIVPSFVAKNLAIGPFLSKEKSQKQAKGFTFIAT
jgi:hypothetical protein